MEKGQSLYSSCITITKQEYRELYERAETFAKLTGRMEAFADFVNSQAKEKCPMIDISSCAAILGFEVVSNAGE